MPVTIPQGIKDLLATPAFWAALLVLKNKVIDWLLPQIPPDVSQAFDECLLVVVGVLSGVQIQTRRADRTFRARAGDAR